MGISNAVVELRNPRRGDLEPVEIEALADTGSTHLCIPASIRDALELEAFEERPVVLADGTRRSVPYVGPIELRYAGRIGFTGALVMGDQALLGLVPMEDMDLVVVPRTHRVVPNPANPGPGGSIALSPLPPSVLEQPRRPFLGPVRATLTCLKRADVRSAGGAVAVTRWDTQW